MAPETVELLKPWWKRLRKWLDSFGVRFTLSCVAVLSLLVTGYNIYHEAQYSTCIAAYDNAASAASQQRVLATSDSYSAIDTMIKAIANAQTLPNTQRSTAIQDAFQHYLTSRGAADEQRKLNPLPAPPSETCH